MDEELVRDQERARVPHAHQRQRYHHETHEGPDAESKHDTGPQGTPKQRGPDARRGEIDRGRAQGDEEVKTEAEGRRAEAAFERARPEESARDSLEHAQGPATKEQRDHDGVGDVESACDQPADYDRLQRPRAHA